ncbi:MAG: cytochrome b5-like heme/steroid binding domain-containing protein [Patescibacteria group bacterium]
MMKKIPKQLIILLGIIVFIVVASAIGFGILRRMTLSTPPTSVTASPAVAGKFTLDELAKHNTKTDCYIAYQGNVFNITWFIPQHEGGEIITQECGMVVDEFSKIHPGGPFTKSAIQAVLQASKVGVLEN